MIHRLVLHVAAFTLGVVFLSPPAALSASFPEKPVRLLLGFGAGSGIDMEARGIAPFLEKHLRTKVIIENIPGVSGKIASTKIWKNKPDGYSLLLHTTTMSIIGQYMLAPEYRVPDFSHIFSWSVSNQVLVTNSEVFKTFDDFLKEAKKRTLSAGLPGIGTVSHLSSLMLADGLGIKVNWVPFNGGGDALVALAGNHINFATVATTSALPLVKAGRVTPLVVMANGKDIVFPNIPLAKDLGYTFPVLPMLRGAEAPPNTPLPIVKTLESAFAKAIQEPEFIAWAKNRMMEIQPLGSVKYGQAILMQQKEIEKYKRFLKE
jgi:tripartite-type tricarboxylate transporter receptor subunit TctC